MTAITAPQTTTIETAAETYEREMDDELVPGALKTIKWGHRIDWAVLLLAMGLSYTHQGAFLGHDSFFGWGIPAIYDLTILRCVTVLNTPVLPRKAHKIAAWILVPFLAVSCTVNFLAPGPRAIAWAMVTVVVAMGLIKMLAAVAGKADPTKLKALEARTSRRAAADTAATRKAEIDQACEQAVAQALNARDAADQAARRAAEAKAAEAKAEAERAARRERDRQRRAARRAAAQSPAAPPAEQCPVVETTDWDAALIALTNGDDPTGTHAA